MVDIDMPRNSKIVKKYPKVLNALRLKIRRGHYGGMLPGVQQLARDFDVNFMTVNKAVNMLVDENLLYRIPNKGTFVRRTFRIALVFLFKKDSRNQRRQTVYDDLIHGVEEALNEKNMTMVFKNIDPESELLSLKNMKNESDGLILLGAVSPKVNKTLGDFPVVRVMGAVDESDTRDHVTYNNHSIGRLAAEHMLRKGFKECAFVCSSNWQLLLDRGLAFCETFAKAGGHVSMLMPENASANSLNTNWLTGRLAKMLEQKTAPAGLFIPAVWMADSIYSFLNSRNAVPGKDIEIVTCDKELMELSKLIPRPAYVDTHVDFIGKKAVEVLSERIEFPGSPMKKILMEPDLVLP
ncbi:MAG: GntR family transcriptional regulator [Victivallales bacterium]|jgi:DNA-binding LacI/PurR family transcriptional regulator